MPESVCQGLNQDYMIVIWSGRLGFTLGSTTKALNDTPTACPHYLHRLHVPVIDWFTF